MGGETGDRGLSGRIFKWAGHEDKRTGDTAAKFGCSKLGKERETPQGCPCDQTRSKIQETDDHPIRSTQ